MQQSGIGSLYVGLSASLLRQMSYSLVRLGAYDAMKSHLSKDKQATAGSLFLAACLAGAMGGIAGNPAGALPAYFMTFGIELVIIHYPFCRYPLGEDDE